MFIILNLYSCLCVTFAAERFFTAQNGYRNDGIILETVLVPTVTHCAMKCVSDVDCNVYNIGTVVGTAGAAGLTCETIRSDPPGDASAWTQQASWDMYTGKYAFISKLNIYMIIRAQFFFFKIYY